MTDHSVMDALRETRKEFREFREAQSKLNDQFLTRSEFAQYQNLAGQTFQIINRKLDRLLELAEK